MSRYIPVVSVPVNLFPPLSTALLALLHDLSPDDWQRPTVCGDWTVKNVAAHLLGGNLSRLSFGRDALSHARINAAPLSNAELLAVINRANAEWVAAAQRLSPRVITDLLELTEPQVNVYFASLAPDALSSIGVSWAGETRSTNAFDIAREYTEKWHHQQHIRDAVGKPGMTERAFIFPVLDTFMRALPFTYRDVAAGDGTSLAVTVTGAAGVLRQAKDDWSLVREGGAWRLYSGAAASPTAHVTLDADTAWRLFTKGISAETALPHMQFEGDQGLGKQILQMVSIVA